MKRLIILLVIALVPMIFAGSSTWAGSVTIPNTFVAGTTARASEVNANFTAVKTAVDDNDAKTPGIDYNHYSIIGGGAISGTTQTVTSVAVTCPTNGYVLASASGMALIVHTSGASSLLSYRLTTNATYSIPDWWIIGGSYPDGLRFLNMPSAAATGNYRGTLATHAVFQVIGGTTVTIYLRAKSGSLGAADDVSVDNVDIQAIFVPNRY